MCSLQFQQLVEDKPVSSSQYTARNASALMQVVDFSSLTQVSHKICVKSVVDFINLHQVRENQTLCNMIFTDLLQQACRRFFIKLVDNLQQTCI